MVLKQPYCQDGQGKQEGVNEKIKTVNAMRKRSLCIKCDVSGSCITATSTEENYQNEEGGRNHQGSATNDSRFNDIFP